MNGKRKIQQLKSYTRIMKIKKQTGEIVQLKPLSSKNMEEEDVEQFMEKQKECGKDADEGSLKEEDFEDQFSDEYEDEEAWVDESSSNEDVQGTNQSPHEMIDQIYEKKGVKKQEKEEKAQVYIGTNKHLKKGEVLDFDNNAYDMLHRLNTEWPSLSIDFIAQDSPFAAMKNFQTMNAYPYEVFTVQGSCNNTKNNSIYLTKWSKLHRTKFDSDPDAVNEQEGNDDQEAEVLVQEIPTTFNVNRLRALKNSPIVAFWNEIGEINILDLTQNYEKLVNGIGTKKKVEKSEDSEMKLIKIKSKSEGFAINWNPHKVGQLATGNTSSIVQIFENNQNYSSWQKTHEYTYHKSSVEDIVFSPNQQTVFASCSSDGTLQIVDMRVGKFNQSQVCVYAHKKDVNVCDWNKIATHLIVTGSDDCSVKVWDLRMCAKSKGKNSEELLAFKWHKQPITSIKFQPNDESSIAVASEDNSITMWDMSVENEQEDPDIPNQLMFIHQGQEQIKEISFHPVYFQMLVSSALDGINIFKPSFEMPQNLEQGKQDLKYMKPIPEKQLDKYLERMSLND